MVRAMVGAEGWIHAQHVEAKAIKSIGYLERRGDASKSELRVGKPHKQPIRQASAGDAARRMQGKMLPKGAKAESL